jgi:hypothetical protein
MAWFLRWATVAGLLLQLIGSILLFRFGLPGRIPTGGYEFITDPTLSQTDLKLDRLYGWLGLLGIGLVALGTFLQLIPAAVSAWSE